MDVRTVPLSRRLNRVDCFVRDADTDELIDVVSCVTKPRERYQIDSVYERIRAWARANNETVGVYARGCQLYVPMELRPTYSLLQEHCIEARGRIYAEEDGDV